MKDNVGQRAPAHRSPRQDPCFDPLIRSPVSRDSRAAASGSFLDWKGLPVLGPARAGPGAPARVSGSVRSRSFLASTGERTGVEPLVTTCFGPRTVAPGVQRSSTVTRDAGTPPALATGGRTDKPSVGHDGGNHPGEPGVVLQPGDVGLEPIDRPPGRRAPWCLRADEGVAEVVSVFRTTG